MTRILICLCLFTSFAAFALDEFPPKVTLLLRDKMSCRDVKKLLKKNRLFVHCEINTGRSRAYSADYLGQAPLDTVLTDLTKNPKVEVAAPYTEHRIPEEKVN